MMFTVTCVLFDPLPTSKIPDRSKVYSPQWVDIMWRMLDRNLTREWRLVCLTHYPKEAFHEDVVVVQFLEDSRDVWCINEVLRPDLEVEQAMFVGLDTVIVRNIDFIADWRGDFAMPRFQKQGAGLKWENPIILYSGKGGAEMWHGRHRGLEDSWVVMQEFGPSEMRYWSKFAPEDTADIHAMWPGKIVPYDAMREGPMIRKDKRPGTTEELHLSAKIIYFYGVGKPHTTDLEIAKEHWR